MNKKQIKNLISAVKIVALEYEDQLQCFPDFVYVPDEIALTLDYEIYILEHITNKDDQFLSIEKKIRQLDQYFGELSPKIFTLDNVKNAKEWRTARIMAREILDDLNEIPEIPSLPDTTYIPSKRSNDQ